MESTATNVTGSLAGVKVHPWLEGAQGLERLLGDPTSFPFGFACWFGPNGIDVHHHGVSGDEPLFNVALTPGEYERGVPASRVLELVAPILERPELTWVCRTCGARVGQPCAIRDLQYVGVSHKPRVRKFERYQVRAEAWAARFDARNEQAGVE